MTQNKTWLVQVPVEVTAKDADEAVQFALADLRDPSLPWEQGTINVQQTSGPHPPIGVGYCRVADLDQLLNITASLALCASEWAEQDALA